MDDITKAISDYIRSISDIYQRGNATEHSYRGALATLLDSMDPSIKVTNEPKRIAAGAPDLAVTRNDESLGWCEAKDIYVDLNNLTDSNQEQKARYVGKLENLIYTNHLDFEFIYKGEQVAFVSIAEIRDGKIVPLRKNFIYFRGFVEIFFQRPPPDINTAEELAKAMARKAELIKNNMGQALVDARTKEISNPLIQLYDIFKEMLRPDIEIVEFADIYAETITYGLFAARYHQTQTAANPTVPFTRAKALELVPDTNPFLKNLFGHIAAKDLDPRLRRIIDVLCDIYQAADFEAIMKGFGRFSPSTDPFIDFYELFLKTYNPKKRKGRGVWYTPAPAVDFIVCAVDDLLKSEFDLPTGLADFSKAKGSDVHRVQILDPAVGTGTFLAAVVNKIQDHVAQDMPDMWSTYVEDELIPRLHGFEVLMASYAICHIKLNLVLSQAKREATPYRPSKKAKRFSVYLTNSLTEGSDEQHSMPFADWFAEEANKANLIKRQTPIMCVIGNPPYSGHSENKGEHFAWIDGLVADYKKEPDSSQRLQERNSKWLNDDYVKFIRLSQDMIEKNGEGILGLITNHSYLDGPIFRGMRWQLLNVFDKIWILDLHGNSRRKEVSPDGSTDVNIFDIQQGVAIIIAVKKKHIPNKSKPLAQLWHGELWGSRKSKYESLKRAKLDKRIFTKIKPRLPHYLFTPRNYTMEASYRAGFSVATFLPISSVGIVTARDGLTIDSDKEVLWQRVEDFKTLDSETLRRKYNLGKDTRDWKILLAKQDIIDNFSRERLALIAYRPFDMRWTYYTGHSRGFHCMPRGEVMHHMLAGANIALQTTRQKTTPGDYANVLVHSVISESTHISNKASEIGSSFPLYLYPNGGLEAEIRINFEPKLYKDIRKAAGMSEVIPAPQPEILETARGDKRADEVKVFDYIYAVLHCPAYREAYREFLKRDFPHVPLPSDAKSFAKLSKQGERLRLLHLMDIATIGKASYPFRGGGDGKVEKATYSTANKSPRVYINDSQYFDNIPREAWDMTIGGYRPAERWLVGVGRGKGDKGRKGSKLSVPDIEHYQRIIKVLSETAKLMDEIKVPNLPHLSNK